ncbi:hypothetical protein VNO77_08550 [Canavalia gladiata]|uniref:Uncharacterized protein n=1 Tax=Canavalia gladiata TaxID=3824 RepID=A0AAN9QX27_CANGL
MIKIRQRMLTFMRLCVRFDRSSQLGRGVRGFESASPKIIVAGDEFEDPMEHSRVFRFPYLHNLLFFSMDPERILQPVTSVVSPSPPRIFPTPLLNQAPLFIWFSPVRIPLLSAS